MSDLDTRIERFRQMTEADPRNVLGHFSLGRAYLEAGQADAAIAALERAIGLDPTISRAYQFAGEALMKRNMRDAAVQRWTEGLRIAHERGDLAVKNDLIRAMEGVGAAVPQLQQVQAAAAGEGQVTCSRCKRVGPKLPAPPFRHKLGQEIHEKVCAPCWKEWIAMGTKVINELRLPLHEPEAQRIFDTHMKEFLNL